MTTEQLAQLFKLAAWTAVFCAFAAMLNFTDDMAGRMFGPIAVFAISLMVAFCLHITCSFIVDLGYEKGKYAYRTTLVMVVGTAFLLWVLGAIAVYSSGM